MGQAEHSLVEIAGLRPTVLLPLSLWPSWCPGQNERDPCSCQVTCPSVNNRSWKVKRLKRASSLVAFGHQGPKTM